MRMSLQDMVAGAISEADRRTKLAQAGEEVESDLPKKKKKKEETEEEEKEKESAGMKCASIDTSTVEKVASALDYINNNMDRVEWAKVAVGKPMPAQPGQGVVTPTGGPAAGAGSELQTNMSDPTLGMQNDQLGQAKTGQPPMNPPADDVGKADGQTNPATAMQTDMKHVPGGTGEQPQLHQEGNLPVMKQASVNRVRKILNMRKMAQDGSSPAAQISAGAEPLENPDGTAAEEKVPKLPGPAQAQANLVQTTDPTKPADITKREAKAEPKRQMGEVITEPAQKKSTDPVLQNNLTGTEQAGVKISSVQAKAARTYLQKLAQAGEDPDASPEEKEKAKKLKEALSKKDEKEKDSQMGGATAPIAAPPAAAGGGLAGM